MSDLNEIIKEVKKGKVVVIVDDESREGEGDLFVAAEFVNVEIINFMITNARGMLCVPMTKKKAEELGIKFMVPDEENTEKEKCRFGVTIDAKEGTTTGVSAFDRALTIRKAVDDNVKAEDFRRPGHVFPLIAEDGGVFVRRGHTEAAVDLVRLAGLKEAGVICEIMNEDGTMAHGKEIEEFAEKHNIKLVKIEDILKYRIMNEEIADEFFMPRALQLAYSQLGNVSPNPSVGAVLVKDGTIISEGVTQKPGGNHAEIEAMQKVNAEGATLYVTLEPCCHANKRTKPCVYEIINSGVKKVVIAAKDENPEVNGRSIEILKKAGIEVVFGVMEEKARKVNEFFFKWISKKIPFVTVKFAITLDDKFTWGDERRKQITGEQGQTYVHELRSKYDAILVGVNTVIKDDPKLTCRLVEGRNPVRVVLDSKLKMQVNASMFNEEGKTIVFCTNEYDKEKAKELEKFCEIVVVNGADGRVDLNDALKTLGERGITSVLVEGGAETIASFVRNGLADKGMFFVAPFDIGEGRSIFDYLNKWELKLKDIYSYKVGGDTLIEGYFEKSEDKIEKIVDLGLPTVHGNFKLIAFRNLVNGNEEFALVKGDVIGKENVLVRVHSSCLTGEVFGSLKCDCDEQLQTAMCAIERTKEGVIVYLRQEGRGIGLLNKLKAYKLQEEGLDTVEANLELGFDNDERDYSVAANILKGLGVRSIVLLSNNKEKGKELEKYGIKVNEVLNLETMPTVHNIKYLEAKQKKMGHVMDVREKLVFL